MAISVMLRTLAGSCSIAGGSAQLALADIGFGWSRLRSRSRYNERELICQLGQLLHRDILFRCFYIVGNTTEGRTALLHLLLLDVGFQRAEQFGRQQAAVLFSQRPLALAAAGFDR